MLLAVVVPPWHRGTDATAGPPECSISSRPDGIQARTGDHDEQDGDCSGYYVAGSPVAKGELTAVRLGSYSCNSLLETVLT